MGNVFPPNKDIHQTFDLKGSVVGREVSDEDIKNNQAIVMKGAWSNHIYYIYYIYYMFQDLNWTNQSKRLELGPLKHKLLMDQLKSDVEFLTKMRIMDYSLLTGIHFMRRGNSENIRDKSLSVFEVLYAYSVIY